MSLRDTTHTNTTSAKTNHVGKLTFVHTCCSKHLGYVMAKPFCLIGVVLSIAARSVPMWRKRKKTPQEALEVYVIYAWKTNWRLSVTSTFSCSGMPNWKPGTLWYFFQLTFLMIKVTIPMSPDFFSVDTTCDVGTCRFVFLSEKKGALLEVKMYFFEKSKRQLSYLELLFFISPSFNIHICSKNGYIIYVTKYLIK